MITPETDESEGHQQSIEIKNKANNLKEEHELYEKIVKSQFYKLTMPEQIRSGASVRLRDIDSKYYTVSDYFLTLTLVWID